MDAVVRSASFLTSSATTAKPTVKHPTTIDAWQALWKSEREAVVKKIKAGKFGIAADGKSALISDGYTVDLAKCPSGWSNTERQRIQARCVREGNNSSPVVDTVGSGDAFTAGLIYGMLRKWSGQDSVEFATAAGVLWGATQGVDWSLSLLLIKALAIAILGGLDSIIDIEDELRHFIVPIKRNDRFWREPAATRDVNRRRCWRRKLIDVVVDIFIFRHQLPDFFFQILAGFPAGIFSIESICNGTHLHGVVTYRKRGQVINAGGLYFGCFIFPGN